MEIVFITFESELSLKESESRFRERVPQFRDMDGLRQKCYVHDEESGRVGGIYVFDSEASRDALFESEIHAKLREDSDVRSLDIDTFHVVFSLYESGGVSTSVDAQPQPLSVKTVSGEPGRLHAQRDCRDRRGGHGNTRRETRMPTPLERTSERADVPFEDRVMTTHTVESGMGGSRGPTVSIEFDRDEYDRLLEVTDSPAELVYDSAIRQLELEESIAFTRDGGFRGPEGFTKIMDAASPTWPLGSLLGIELRSMGDGESRWVLEAGPEHANPMGTIHGGVLCDLGDAALSTAYMSTVDPDDSFTTVDLTVNYLRPVWSGRLEAVGRVVHKGRTIGLAECDITTDEGTLVARLSGTCMTLQKESADRTVPTDQSESHTAAVTNNAQE